MLKLEDPTEVIVLVSFFAVSGAILWGFFGFTLIRHRRARKMTSDVSWRR